MLAFCEKCRDKVNYSVNNIEKSKEIKGNEIKYIGKEAYCNQCGSNIFVKKIRNYNLQKLDEEYRKSENIITISDIKKIVEDYNTGKRPLSKLIGWGEGTLSRYLDGDIPSKNYSNTLKKIQKEPNYMKELLEENKDRVSKHAYNKCKKAIKKLLKEKKPETNSKIDSATKYILKKSSEITPLALQKLLYYTQSFYNMFYEDFIFEEDCEAWIHGPVYKEIYHKYKNFGYNPIENNNMNFDDIKLNKIEKEILDSIINYFGRYSGKVLEEMTHNETPWLITRKDINDNEASNKIIKKELINNYFSKIKEKYNILSVSDIKDYSNNLFNKIYN